MPLTIGNPADIWTVGKIPDLSGKTCVITGGNEGIGAATVNYLLQNKIKHVYNLSNDPAREAGAREFWNKDAGGADVAKNVTFYEVDLGNYDAVRKAADKIKQQIDSLDILICDAAIGMYATDVPPSTEREGGSKQAIDRHFAANNVGHAVLTQELLPLVKAAGKKNGDARIVYLASNLHYSCPSETKFASIDELNADLGPTLQYNRSKMGNVLYVKKLARELKKDGVDNVFCLSVHPGVVATSQQDGVLESYGNIVKEELGETAGSVAETVMVATNHAARAVGMKDSLDGSLSTLWSATSPEIKERGYTGEFVVPRGHVQEADKRALDEGFQDRCWDLIQLCIKQNYANDVGADHTRDSTARGSSTI